MIKPGPKTLIWDKIRQQIKKDFFNLDITACEIGGNNCWYDNSLGFAHTKKRRNLEEWELYHVVLACTNCHNRAESMKEEDMQAFLEGIIIARNHIKELMGYRIPNRYKI